MPHHAVSFRFCSSSFCLLYRPGDLGYHDADQRWKPDCELSTKLVPDCQNFLTRNIWSFFMSLHLPMSRINEAFERLEAGKAQYRIVLDADF
jgi:hypothetical protein